MRSKCSALAIEDIKALPVQAIAAEDALLWLWTTTAHLRVSFEVVEAWGFTYKTLLTGSRTEWAQVNGCAAKRSIVCSRPVESRSSYTANTRPCFTLHGASIPESPKASMRWSRLSVQVRKSNYSRVSTETTGETSEIRPIRLAPVYGDRRHSHLGSVYKLTTAPSGNIKAFAE